jgi:hypothetical protein
METLQQVITQEHIQKGYSYEAYRAIVDSLLKENKSTGPNQSESLLNYTKLNVQRMNKWDKIIKLDEELIAIARSINTPIHWVVLTEGWCGDAAQNLPVIAKVAALNPHIKLTLLLRDENPEVMEAYLTKGGKSIPKLIMLNEDLEPLKTWGPRPGIVQNMLFEMKSESNYSYDTFAVAAHTWYAKDKGKTLQQELKALLY